jgi:hypothetical protein
VTKYAWILQENVDNDLDISYVVVSLNNSGSEKVTLLQELNVSGHEGAFKTEVLKRE